MKKILIIVEIYLPGVKGGGPIQSIKNLVDILGEKVQFKILTQDRDLGDEKEYPNIKKNIWVRNGKVEVYYCNKKKLYSMKFLLNFLKNLDIDIIYLNSFFSITSIIITVLNKVGFLKKKEIILAPRGEFSPEALNLKKYKKMTYIRLAQFLKLYDKVIFHATNGEEKQYIQKYFKNQKYRIASNLKQLESINNLSPKNKNELNLIFLSRISPKKNLKYILELFLNLDYERIKLDIYGPIEDKVYWQECEKLIEKLKNVKVRYQGIVENENVKKIFSKYNFFIFPTLGENYGHVIIESLLASTPLMLSTETPWHNLDKEGIGYEIELLNQEKWLNKLKEIYLMENKEYKMLNGNCKRYIEKYKKETQIKDIKDNFKLFDIGE